MTNVTQNIHGVTDVKADMLLIMAQKIAVSFTIETDEGDVSQTLFFKKDVKGQSKARMLFALLGGTEDDVVDKTEGTTNDKD